MANLHLAIELTKLDDLKLSAKVAEKFSGPWCRCWFSVTEPEGYCARCEQPRLHFARSLDACHQVEMTLQENGFLRYGNILHDVIGAPINCGGMRNYQLATATPRDHCIAILLSKEKS